jgi:hypothetical protein
MTKFRVDSTPEKIKLDPVLKEMFLQRLRGKEGYHLAYGVLSTVKQDETVTFCALGLLADTAGLWVIKNSPSGEYLSGNSTYLAIKDIIGFRHLNDLMMVNDCKIHDTSISAIKRKRRSRVIKWVKENL